MAPNWHRFEFYLFYFIRSILTAVHNFSLSKIASSKFDKFVIGLAALKYWLRATRCQQLTNFVLKQSHQHIHMTGEAAFLALLALWYTWCCSRRLLTRLWTDGGDASSLQYILWNYTSLLLGWWNIHDLYRGQNTIPTPLLTIHQTKLAVYSVHITMTTNVSRWVWARSLPCLTTPPT